MMSFPSRRLQSKLGRVSDPKRIDRYEVRGILGHGAMGHVYLAWDPKLHREVAVKVVAKNLTRDAKGRERFHREARAIAALKHPNIVEIYDYSGENSEELYLVMEKLNGDDLFNVVAERGASPEAVAAAIGHEICLALGVAHDSGIIHRDIKPENVFIDATGRVVLTDFGVVKAVRQGSAVDGWTAETDVIGTPGFMAPEVMMNRSLGPRTDIFALGALLYNVATAAMPFDGESPVELFRNVVASKITDPRSIVSTLSDEFVAVLSRCLEAKPKDRFRSAQQVRERLKLVLELNGVTNLHDDIRDYIADASSYSVMADRRAVNHLVNRLKVSLKDHDRYSEQRIRERLLVIDPSNREIRDLSGMRPSLTPAMRQPTQRYRFLRGRRLAVGVSALAAVSAGAYGLWQQRDAQPSLPGIESSTNNTATAPTTQRQKDPDGRKTLNQGLSEPRPSSGQEQSSDLTSVSLTIRGGRGAVFIDGASLGRHRSITFERGPGTYHLEVRGNRRKLKKTLELGGGELKIVADLRCRRRSCITVKR